LLLSYPRHRILVVVVSYPRRHRILIIRHNIHPPIPAPELIVDSITNAIDEASDMSGNVDGIMGGKGDV
jgi:hypothetical protein